MWNKKKKEVFYALNLINQLFVWVINIPDCRLVV